MFLVHLVQRIFMVKFNNKVFKKFKKKYEIYNKKYIYILDFCISDFFLQIYALFPKSAQKFFL